MSMISEQIESLRDMAEYECHVSENMLLADILDSAADTIEMLSEKARGSKQEWIPCSERLPTSEYGDDERVLATTDVDGLGVIITPAYDVKSRYNKGYVSAWMPLPEPPKGADDE